jgi:hypothetical protein
MIVNLVEIRISELVTDCDRFNCSRSQIVTLNKYVRKTKSSRQRVRAANMQNLWSQIATTKNGCQRLNYSGKLKGVRV